MNENEVRGIIQEKLNDILSGFELISEAPQLVAVNKDSGRLVHFSNPENLKMALKKGSHVTPDAWKKATGKDPLSTDGKQLQQPEDPLEPLKASVPDETPEWVNSEEMAAPTELATLMGLVPSDQEGEYADVSGNQPLVVVVATDDKEAPLMAHPELPEELQDEINDKIQDAMEDPDFKEEPEEIPEPETSEESDPPVDTQQMDKQIVSMYGKGAGKGMLLSYNPKGGEPTDKPPSDAIARQTALETGFPNQPGGEKKSKTTGRLAEPAPGNPGSLLNEILSIEGSDIARKLEESLGRMPTVSEVGYVLDKQFGDTVAAKQNGAPGAVEYKKKLRVAAEASIRKHNRYRTMIKQNPDFGPVESVNQYYGASDSLDAQKNMIMQMPKGAKIYGPDGPIDRINVSRRVTAELEEAVVSLVQREAKEGRIFSDTIPVSGGKSSPKADKNAVKEYVNSLLSDPENSENIKQFVAIMAMAGGGGANPSDTATFVQDKKGNVAVMWHSDKMDRGDQQANSTLIKEAAGQIDNLESLLESGLINQKQFDQAKQSLERFSQEVDQIESGELAPTVAKNLQDMMKNTKTKKHIQDAWKKILSSGGSTKNLANEFSGPEELFNHVANPNSTLNKAHRRGMEKFAKLLSNDLSSEDIAKIDISALAAKNRSDVVSSIHKRMNSLNKIKTDRGNLGDLLEAQNIIDKLHLYAMNEDSELAYQSGMCETIIGKYGINGEVLREALGVDNTDDLLTSIKVGKPSTPEGDYVDADTGIPEAQLQRSADTFERKNEKVMYWVTDDTGKIVGKAPEGTKLKSGQSFKTLKSGSPVPVGVVTGQRSLLYVQTKDGKDLPIAFQMVRSKSGATGRLGTAYTFSKELQNLLGQLDKVGLVTEILKRLVGRKVLVENIKKRNSTTSTQTKLPKLSFIIKEMSEKKSTNLFLKDLLS